LVCGSQPVDRDIGRLSRAVPHLSLKEMKLMNSEIKTARPSGDLRWRNTFQRRKRMHDPMLVLNMSIFNSTDGWNRISNPLKVHEKVT
jgi:hypothetical protein